MANTEEKARAPRRRRRAAIRTEDVGAGDSKDIDISSHVAEEDIDRPDLAAVSDADMDEPHVQEYLKDLRFMEDILTIVIGDTTDPNAENPVPCGVNGERKLLYRGQEYKIARKFVDSLIKREDAIKTQQYLDPDGCVQTKVITTPRLKYPISVLHDPAGETGRRWFEYQCKNAW